MSLEAKDEKKKTQRSKHAALKTKFEFERLLEEKHQETFYNESNIAKANFIQDKILVTEREEPLVQNRRNISPKEITDIEKLQSLALTSPIDNVYSGASRSLFSPNSTSTETNQSSWSDSDLNTPSRLESSSLIRT